MRVEQILGQTEPALAGDNKRKFTLGVLGFVARRVEVLGALETSEWCSRIPTADNSPGSVTRESVTTGNLTPGNMGLPGGQQHRTTRKKVPKSQQEHCPVSASSVATRQVLHWDLGRVGQFQDLFIEAGSESKGPIPETRS